MVIREGVGRPVVLSVTLTLRGAENSLASERAVREIGPTSISSMVLGATMESVLVPAFSLPAGIGRECTSFESMVSRLPRCWLLSRTFQRALAWRWRMNRVCDVAFGSALN